MDDNYPPGFDPRVLDAPEDMTETEKSEFIDDHDGILREYHADHVAEGILDDDLPDAYDAWVVTLSEADLLKIAKK